MSEEDKKNFDFIKEEVIQKKSKKRKKWLISFIMTVCLAIIFGIVASVIFCISTPKFYKLLHKEEKVKTPIYFPTVYPDAPNKNESKNPDSTDQNKVNDTENKEELEPTPVVVNKIDADIDDFINMTEDIRTVAYQANKSLVTISSIISEKDWFGDSVETEVDTTGVVMAKTKSNLLILVSLDRIKDASSIKLKLTEVDKVDAVIQDYETELNLAVLSVNIKDIPQLFLSNNIVEAKLGESYTLAVGNPVIALGNPNGYPGSMDFGIITSKGSNVSITDNRLDLFNTSLVFSENSDGVIFNMKGEVIGLVTRTLKEGLNEKLSTVVGISKVQPILQDMLNKEDRIYCGVITEDMTDKAKKEYEVGNGIYINEVKPSSPAAEAGMKEGDIIIVVGDKSILNTNSFYNIISDYQVGDEVTFKIIRTTGNEVKEMSIKVVLSEKNK